MSVDYETQEQDPVGLREVKLVILLILVFVVAAFLMGCDASTRETTYKYVLPEGMKDCKLYYMSSGGGGGINVVRCPNSSTATVSGGKAKSYTITVDGVEYEATKKEKE